MFPAFLPRNIIPELPRVRLDRTFGDQDGDGETAHVAWECLYGDEYISHCISDTC